MGNNFLKAGKWWVLLATLAVSACTTSPTGRSQFLFMPEEQLNEMGAQTFAQMRDAEKTESGTTTSRYVACVAAAITRGVDTPYMWDLSLFDSEQVNAFALPGGKIGVYKGLLNVATTQDQLAAVIGHEVAHVLAQHGNERMSLEYASQTGQQLLGAIAQNSEKGQQIMGLLGVGMQFGVAMPFSRAQESEADIMGLELMAQAGFDPSQAVVLWQNMSAAGGAGVPEILSTHPSDAHRIKNLQAHMSVANDLYLKARQNGSVPYCKG